MTKLNLWNVLCLTWTQMYIVLSEGTVSNMTIVYEKNYNYVQNFPIDRDACQDEGILIVNVRIYVDSVQKKNSGGCDDRQASREVSYNVVEDKIFLIQLKRECNGRHRCQLLESTKNQLKVNCSRSKVETDAIEINYYCKPIILNNKTVFDISEHNYWWINNTQTTNIYYLVYNTSSQDIIHRKCRVETNGGHIYVRLLHVDWGPGCYGDSDISMTYYIKAGERKFFFCKDFGPVGSLHFHPNFLLEMNSKSNVVWIEIEVNERLSIECKQHEFSSERTVNTKSPDFTTALVATTTSPARTVYNSSSAYGATTLAGEMLSPIVTVGTGSMLSNNVSLTADRKIQNGPKTFLTIVITSGVITALTFITVIILIIILCRRKSKDQKVIDKNTYSLNTPQPTDVHIYHECSETHPYYAEDISQEDVYIELEQS